MASPSWSGIQDNTNLMGLLHLICESLFTRKKSTEALQEAKETLMSFKQHENMDNSNYLEKFKSYVDQVEHHGGQPGCNKEQISPLID